MPQAPQPRPRPEIAPGWAVYLPAAFTVLTLLLLLLVPLYMQRRVELLRDQIDETADPARTLVTRVQFLLARQTSLLRGYLLTGRDAYLAEYEDLAVDEATAYEQLDSLIEPLGPSVLERFVTLRTLSERWHVEVAGEVGEGGELSLPAMRNPAGDGLPFAEDLYLRTLVAAEGLDRAVMRAARLRRDEIRRVEEGVRLLNLALVLAALLAVLGVARLSLRVRRLAMRLDDRRQEAEEALAASQRANDARARLLRGITHDVKNPLGAADGYAELLQMGLRGELTPGQAEMIASIRRSVRSALDIIRDLLDLSRADRVPLQVARVPLDLAALAAQAVHDHEGAARQAGHTLRMETPSDGARVYTDGQRVSQVLGNLLSNAIKYTPGGGEIRVRVETVGEQGEQDQRPGRWATVAVADTGPGIPEAERERIFAEFHRLHPDTIPGHGLGLAISRQIARLLGGDITVQDGAGAGAVFTLWLPVRTEE